MKEFNDVNRLRLVEGDYYLVQADDFCESGFEIAQWVGGCFLSQANGSDITGFVKGYTNTGLLPIV